MRRCDGRGTPDYRIDEQGDFILEGYNQAKPFSNFFPGVAGLWGIPMWVFYVNRGQCVSSFGIASKDKAMVEFLPANKAYRQTSITGFRTFVKVSTGKEDLFWEPFQQAPAEADRIRQQMRITSHDLTIEEENRALGLRCRVNYFTIPEEPFPALVRRVSFENIGRQERRIEVVDGLPVFLPYGMNDWAVKNMSRTVEAWVKVQNLEARAPYYHLNVEVSDTPYVRHIHEGNFYFAFEEGKSALLPVVVSADCVFGAATDFLVPQRFLKDGHFHVPSTQETSNRTPSAMSFARLTLAPGRMRTLVSFMGHAHSLKQLGEVVEKATEKKYVATKECQNRDIVAGLKNYAFTHSASPVFDRYTTQTFLDNVMRGGLPVSVMTQDGPVAVSVFSRKHGDPERDYNFFVLSPTYYSQGNGNFRDVNQNRRNDVWFNTDVADSNILTFFSLSQADGYNPLIVKGLSFFGQDEQTMASVLKQCLRGDAEPIAAMIQRGFQPGELLSEVMRRELVLKVTAQEFLGRVLSACRQQTVAEHGEGFWVDHWTYNIDLVESYLAIFPERLRELLLEKKEFTFFHNDHYILPRDQRYVLTPKGVRQYHSVADGTKSIDAKAGGHLLRTRGGAGDVVVATLAEKILCLIANKAASLDPAGIGIEMEADRPGWYDALNGLPGLLGSSICETFELRRYSRFLLEALETLGVKDHYEISVFDELGEFIRGLLALLAEAPEPLIFWDRANTLKENYRLSVRKGIRGDEQGLSTADVKDFLRRVIARTEEAEERATDNRGRISTYFTYEVTDHEVLSQAYDRRHCVMPRAFKRHDLPLFLEGFVHALRVTRDQAAAARIHQAVKASGLFDTKLKMYKVNANLSSENEDIGRARVFPRGWLENESIWLHMEYKYLLELLRAGLYREFHQAMRETLVPFLHAETYGRSILENSSFLVSSAHEDPSLHGQGFVARLSGSTAEFLHIWLWMSVGIQPFQVNHQGELCLYFDPVLMREMFTPRSGCSGRLGHDGAWRHDELPAGTYAVHFLANTLLVYHNPKGRDVVPDGDYRIERIEIEDHHGKRRCFTEGFIPSPYAGQVREGKTARIDVYIE